MKVLSAQVAKVIPGSRDQRESDIFCLIFNGMDENVKSLCHLDILFFPESIQYCLPMFAHQLEITALLVHCLKSWVGFDIISLSLMCLRK